MSAIFVFNLILRPSSALVLSGFTGTVSMSIALGVLGRVDGELARRLHDLKTPKPISVTPIRHNGNVLWDSRTRLVAPGDALEFRVSTLEGVGVRLLDALNSVDSVKLFNVDSKVEVKSIEVVRVEELVKPGPVRFRIRFLSPIRFARVRTMRRRGVKFDFCPSMENIIRSTVLYWNSVIGGGLFRNWTGLVRWAYNYVYMRDMYGRVVYTRLPGRSQPQLGFWGNAEYEVKSRRESRITQLWALLRLAELMNTGTTRSIGFGHIEVVTGAPAGT
jgi:CRISPR-associated protein Cas6